MASSISEPIGVRVKEAVAEWIAVLGFDNVEYQRSKFAAEERTTFVIDRQIVALLRPGNAEELQQVVRIAKQAHISLYTISAGKNWGLGSALPTANQCALVRLDRMNNITDFNEELAYVRVQPGVSFKQLWDFLEAQQSDLMLDGIAGSQHASIVGNTMERGQGVGLSADRFANVCGMEVILPNGECIKTGFAAFDHSKNKSLAKWGLGPQLDGLFTQSNFGIVTELTLWLRPKPKHFQCVVFHLEREEALDNAIDALRQLRLEGLPISLRVYNDIRMFSTGTQYPWEAADHETPLSESLKAKLRKRMKVGRWVGIAGLYSINKSMAKAERKLVRERLKPLVDRLEIYTDRNINRARQLNEKQKDFLVRKSLLRGFVTDDVLNITYWRKKQPVPAQKDLLRDRVGMLWYCPVVPAEGKLVRELAKVTADIHHQFSFEMNIGFLSITARTFDTTGVLLYDLDEEGEGERALACLNALQNAYREAGFTSYRLGLPTMHEMENMDDATRQFLLSLKSHLDPEDIFSPGRYVIWRHWLKTRYF